MLRHDTITKALGAACALLLAASCNDILGNPAPGTDSGMGGGGAPADTGGGPGLGGATGGGGADGACPSGTFDHDANPDTVCQSWSKCQPGQYIFHTGSPTTDRSCKACGAGSFSDTQNVTECSEWIDCEPGEYVAVAGTKEDDRQCEPCADDEYSKDANAARCTPATACGHPWKYAKKSTPVADAECTAPIRQFGSPLGDNLAQAAVDAAGNVYVAGSTSGDLASENAGMSDGYLRKYDASGRIEWETQFGSDDQDTVTDLALDSDGDVYLVGVTAGTLPGGTSTGGNEDAYVVKYSANGVRQLTWQFRGLDDNGSNAATSVAVDGSGNIYVAGTTSGGPTAKGVFLRKYESSGTVAWTATNTADPAASAAWTNPTAGVDTGGTAYLAWHRNGDGVTQNAVAQYPADGDGTAAWTTILNNPAEDLFAPPTGVAATDGSVYVVGYTMGDVGTTNFGGEDAYIVRYDVEGRAVWTDQFGGTGDDRATDVAVDANGDVFVLGVTKNALATPNEGGDDGFLRKYATSGAHRWTQQWGTTSADGAAGVAPDGRGNAFVAGWTSGSLAAQNPSGWPDCYVMFIEPP